MPEVNQQQEHAVIPFEFEGIDVGLLEDGGQYWVTGEAIGRALEYSEPRKNIGKLYDRNADVLNDPDYTCVVSLTTQTQDRNVRIYSLEGVILLLMYSRQPKARAFQVALAKRIANEWRDRLSALEEQNSDYMYRLSSVEGAIEGSRVYGLLTTLRYAQERLASCQAALDGMVRMDGQSYTWWRAERVAKSINQRVKRITFSPGGRVLTVSFELKPPMEDRWATRRWLLSKKEKDRMP